MVLAPSLQLSSRVTFVYSRVLPDYPYKEQKQTWPCLEQHRTHRHLTQVKGAALLCVWGTPACGHIGVLRTHKEAYKCDVFFLGCLLNETVSTLSFWMAAISFMSSHMTNTRSQGIISPNVIIIQLCLFPSGLKDYGQPRSPVTLHTNDCLLQKISWGMGGTRMLLASPMYPGAAF